MDYSFFPALAVFLVLMVFLYVLIVRAQKRLDLDIKILDDRIRMNQGLSNALDIQIETLRTAHAQLELVRAQLDLDYRTSHGENPIN